MATALDLKLRPKAKALIATYGAPYVLRSLNAETYDTETSTTAGGGYTNYPVRAYVSKLRNFFDPSNETRKSMQEVLLADDGLMIKPKTGDLLTIDGVDRRILLATPTYSGELVALWTLGLEN